MIDDMCEPAKTEDELDEEFPLDRKALERAEKLAKILDLRAKGKMVKEIIEETGYAERHIMRLLAGEAERVRKDCAKLVAQRFLEHDQRCEFLYSLCLRRITDPVFFDEKVVRAAVAVLERQAKLLGIDTQKTVGGRPGPNQWLDDAPMKDILSEARKLGVPIPTEFDTHARIS